MSELVSGRSVAEAGSIDQKALVDALGGLPEHKLRCTTAALRALELALVQLRRVERKT
jgi:NifU-like protein involved in Fe-S cluster formation